jgi:hypothetical protein
MSLMLYSYSQAEDRATRESGLSAGNEVIRAAHAALYRAKAKGRDRVLVANGGANAKALANCGRLRGGRERFYPPTPSPGAC